MSYSIQNIIPSNVQSITSENFFLNESVNGNFNSITNIFDPSNIGGTSGKVFSKIVSDFKSNLENTEQIVENFVAGKSDLLDVVMSIKQSENNLKVFLNLGNKFVESLNQIYNISI